MSITRRSKSSGRAARVSDLFRTRHDEKPRRGFSYLVTRRFKKLKKGNSLWILTAAVAIALIIASVVIWQVSKSDSSNAGVVTPTDQCAAKNDITFGCYKQQLNDIISQNGPEPAFALLKNQYDKVSFIKSQCHQLVHVIGRAAYAKYGNIGETFVHGDQYCWAGYYHGMMEQVADKQGTAKFLSSLNGICEEIANQARYSFNHYNCVHGLGHGVMEALNGELFEALAACDKITEDYGRVSCYGGVYMQNIIFSQAPDQEANYKSKYLKDDDPMYPCTAVEEKYKHQCYMMQTSHALQVVNYDFAKVFSLCNELPAPHPQTCYRSLGRDASGQTVSDVQGTKERCMLGPNHEARQYCIMGAASDFVSYLHDDKQALRLCASIPAELQAACESSTRGTFSTF